VTPPRRKPRRNHKPTIRASPVHAATSGGQAGGTPYSNSAITTAGRLIANSAITATPDARLSFSSIEN
jgi:hypothetical protein